MSVPRWPSTVCLLLGAAHAFQMANHGARSGTLRGRAGRFAGMQHRVGSFNCSSFPELCQAPFNCQSVGFLKQMKTSLVGIGRADPQLWCTAPQYSAFASLCLGKDHDLVKAAHRQYEITVAGAYGTYVKEMDASYCFIEGWCVNHEISNNTTLAEAEKMCDKRFGPESWRSFGSRRLRPEDATDNVAFPEDGGRRGFNSTLQTRPFLITACAMGYFHCDAVYCKETYCKKKEYQRKYGHLLQKFGWI